jgi:predicted RNA-binding Zn-ribbon protein involved in translation (DUF1610 family)
VPKFRFSYARHHVGVVSTETRPWHIKSTVRPISEGDLVCPVCGQMTVKKRKGSKKFSHDRQYTCIRDDSDDNAIVKVFDKPSLGRGRVQ